MSDLPDGPPPPPGEPRAASAPPAPPAPPRVWLPGTPLVGAPDAVWAGGHDLGPSPSEPAPAATHRTRPPRRRRTRVAVTLLAVGLTGAVAAAGYLWTTSEAWERRADAYLEASEDLGDQLASTRAELAGARSEIAAVGEQLATAQERIVQLADEKAQLGDDREVQRQLVDYQERVTEAAGRVALALDQCVQGQNQLIGYMENAAQYDPAELDRYAADVQDLCQRATEANTALQSELSR